MTERGASLILLPMFFFFFQVSFGAPKFEIEHLYYPHGGDGQPWGRFSLTSILEYEVNFFTLPGARETRTKEYFFSGARPELSYAGFRMTIARKPMSYLLNYYLPSALFVIVSWATFVIPVDAIPGRIGLIITTLLSLINIANSAFSNSPNSHGINQIQVSR